MLKRMERRNLLEFVKTLLFTSVLLTCDICFQTIVSNVPAKELTIS